YNLAAVVAGQAHRLLTEHLGQVPGPRPVAERHVSVTRLGLLHVPDQLLASLGVRVSSDPDLLGQATSVSLRHHVVRAGRNSHQAVLADRVWETGIGVSSKMVPGSTFSAASIAIAVSSDTVVRCPLSK